MLKGTVKTSNRRRKDGSKMQSFSLRSFVVFCGIALMGVNAFCGDAKTQKEKEVASKKKVFTKPQKIYKNYSTGLSYEKFIRQIIAEGSYISVKKYTASYSSTTIPRYSGLDFWFVCAEAKKYPGVRFIFGTDECVVDGYCYSETKDFPSKFPKGNLIGICMVFPNDVGVNNILNKYKKELPSAQFKYKNTTDTISGGAFIYHENEVETDSLYINISNKELKITTENIWLAAGLQQSFSQSDKGIEVWVLDKNQIFHFTNLKETAIRKAEAEEKAKKEKTKQEMTKKALDF